VPATKAGLAQSRANRQRDLFIADARRNGTATLAELAEQYDITRERVRQIATRMGVDPSQAANAAQHNRDEALEAKLADISDGVMMRYIAGDSPPELAKHFDVSVNQIRSILDERLTDEIIAARSNYRSQRLYPEIGAGPLDGRAKQREDRYWTRDRVWERLVQLAQENGGRLMSSSEYQKISTGREDLPSFRTVRVRLGRWSTVRVEVHKALHGVN
jgi:Mor family transcriptional regulator